MQVLWDSTTCRSPTKLWTHQTTIKQFLALVPVFVHGRWLVGIIVSSWCMFMWMCYRTGGFMTLEVDILLRGVLGCLMPNTILWWALTIIPWHLHNYEYSLLAYILEPSASFSITPVYVQPMVATGDDMVRHTKAVFAWRHRPSDQVLAGCWNPS